MSNLKIKSIWENSYQDFLGQGSRPSFVQPKASMAILSCKSGKLGINISQCPDCGHLEFHNNSCQNRNCPNCQAVNKEIWVDKRRAEVIDSPYFHVVFTLPHELNPLLYCNQQLLYTLLHRCCAQTLLELSADKKWLGATPGIIQVLHTWNQELDYQVHMHCIVSGGGLTPDHKIRKSKKDFLSGPKSSVINLRENILLAWTLFIKNSCLYFPLPVKSSGIPMNGLVSVITFIIRNGVPTARKPLMGLAMRSSILADTPIRLPSQTAVSCRLRMGK